MQSKEDKIAKQRAYVQRQRDKAIERLKDPEVIEKKRAKQKLYQQRAIERAKQKALEPKPPRVKATSKPRTSLRSKGLKGRTPTAQERVIMDAIGQLSCICCAVHGRYSPIISLHHIDGRTKPLAHAKVLPLCAFHHDTPVKSDYPDLIPFHAKGKEGGKAAWIAQNGEPMELLRVCYQLACLDFPFEEPTLRDSLSSLVVIHD